MSTHDATRRHRSNDQSGGRIHYRHLVVMIGLSFLTMYVLMYAMVDVFDNVYSNLNQAYMAGLMAAPMAIIELVVMRMMYRERRLNLVIGGVSVVVLAVCWALIRQQTAIGDRQFLRSMIPHHAGAILMCGEASVSDAEIKALCKNIVTSQQSEIDQMRVILGRLDR